jgi:hypothetical protein
MKCKQTREAIDTTSRRAQHGVSVTSHLNACPDCRRHADETASLLSLLSAQPRVQSPADFDSGLTRRIATAQADETVSMLSLLRTQPRVEVPADFDFRLRARIAREQAERFSPAGVFEKFWERLAQTISLGQAATAMAAAALAVTVSTFYINRDSGAPASSGIVAVHKQADLTPNSSTPASGIALPAVETNGITVNPANKAVKPRRAALIPAAATSTTEMMAGVDSSQEVYSAKLGRRVKNGASFGADDALDNLAKATPDLPSM